MLRLLLLRHSKAVPFTGSGDHKRALTARGRADAARLGAFIAGEKIAPQAAIHSGSRRTGETLDIVLARLKSDAPVSVEPRVYEASEAAFLSVLRHAPDAAKTLLVVGHNPSLGETTCHLAGTGDRPTLLKMAAKFPTSGLAIIDFETDHWREIAAGAGRLVHFATPTGLERGEA
jgi:phosphohistidine phosphatase